MTAVESMRTLRLEGDLTIATALETKAILVDALADGSPMLLDLSEVEEFDTAGLQLLIAVYREAEANGVHVETSACSASVAGVLERLGLATSLGPAPLSPTPPLTDEEDPHVRG